MVIFCALIGELRSSAQGENPIVFSYKNFRWRKRYCLVSSLPPSFFYASFFSSHSFWWLVGCIALSWLDRQSILICSGNTTPFDISPKNWLLWWFYFSLSDIVYSVQFIVWKRPHYDWVIVFLTSQIQFSVAMCHIQLQLFSLMEARTHTVQAHIQMCSFTNQHTPTKIPNQTNRCHFLLLWHPWVCEDESLRGNECEWNVRLQGHLLSLEEDTE